MIVGIEQIEMYAYILSFDSEFKLDLPQALVDEVDDTVTAFIAAQTKLTNMIEAVQKTAEEPEGDEWCAECGKATVADGENCSVCGFLYPVNRLAEDHDHSL